MQRISKRLQIGKNAVELCALIGFSGPKTPAPLYSGEVNRSESDSGIELLFTFLKTIHRNLIVKIRRDLSEEVAIIRTRGDEMVVEFLADDVIIQKTSSLGSPKIII